VRSEAEPGERCVYCGRGRRGWDGGDERQVPRGGWGALRAGGIVMHDEVAHWITEIVTARCQLLAVALCQRAKFEGWLKFELAAMALSQGARVEFEPKLPAGGRADLAIERKGV